MSNKLKPCPFCGSEARFRRTKKESMTGRWDAWIECKGCYAKPYIYEARIFEKEEEVRERISFQWNRRTNNEQ